MAKVCVLGSGSWGTALAVHLAKKGEDVILCSLTEEKFEKIKKERENVSALPGVKIPDSVEITMDLESSVKNADIIVLVTASVYVRETAKRIAPFVRDGQIIVEAAKGIEEANLKMLHEVVEEEIPQAKVAVFFFFFHAEEVGRGIPTTCVVGARDRETAEFVRDVFITDSLRVYINPDMLGIALGGALKNVIALAAGIADGLGYGDNSKAALITRGISEITRLGVKMGADQVTFAGLSGIGDLIVTCESKHSRNRRAGVLIGEGMTPQEAMTQVDMVVEGVYAARSAKKLAGIHGEELPIVNEVVKVLFENKDPAEAVKDLMIRDTVLENRGQDF